MGSCRGSYGHHGIILEPRVRLGILVGPRNRVGIILGSCWCHLGTIVGSQWNTFLSWGHPGVRSGPGAIPGPRCHLKVVWGSHCGRWPRRTVLISFPRCGSRPAERAVTAWRREVGALTLVAQSIFGAVAVRMAPVATAKTVEWPRGKRKMTKNGWKARGTRKGRSK